MTCVDIIIPVYNGAKFLERAVISVVAQTVAAWRLIIVNDGSTDGSGRLAEHLAQSDPRVEVLHQERLGLSAARNAGLTVSNSPLVQFLDADDELVADKIETQAAYLNAHPDCGVVFGRGLYFDGGREVLSEFPPPARSIPLELLIRNFILVNAALSRRSVFEYVGFFQVQSDGRYPVYGCEDWDLWLRAAMAGVRIDFDDRVVVRNHWHASNMSHDRLRMKQSYVWVLSEANNRRRSIPRFLRSFLRSQILFRRIDFLLEAAEAKEWPLMRSECTRFIAEEPGVLGLPLFLWVLATVGREPGDAVGRLNGRFAYVAARVVARVHEMGIDQASAFANRLGFDGLFEPGRRQDSSVEQGGRP